MSFSELTAAFRNELHDNQRYAFWEVVATAAFILGIVVIAAFAIGASASPQAAVKIGAALMLTALAAWMVGSATGFLFGVPRYKADNSSASDRQRLLSQYAPNTNLEQVSDWLTKIIIGATLVQVQVIPGKFQNLCDWIAGHLGQPDLAVVAGGAIIFFGLTGFLWCYLWSSIRIMRELARIAEQAAEEGEPEQRVRA